MNVIEEIFEGKDVVCEEILRALPEWFQYEEAIINYIHGVENCPVFVAKDGGILVGFISLKEHNPYTAEIFVMGVKKDFQRKGIGTGLLETAKNYLREKGYKFLTTKTLSPSKQSREYETTREFYAARGFYPVEEFKELWDSDNPCLLMLKVIG